MKNTNIKQISSVVSKHIAGVRQPFTKM